MLGKIVTSIQDLEKGAADLVLPDLEGFQLGDFKGGEIKREGVKLKDTPQKPKATLSTGDGSQEPSQPKPTEGDNTQQTANDLSASSQFQWSGEDSRGTPNYLMDTIEGEGNTTTPPLRMEDDKVYTPQFPDLPTANSDYIEQVKVHENSTKEGFKDGKFYPINSAEGKGTLNPSGQEIGYGILVKPEWLGTDESKYPVVDGVPVDVRGGITEEQATALVNDIVTAKQTELFDAYPDIGKMTTPLKMYWTDFTYNGGVGAIKKNPSALKALKAKQPVEAVIKTFNYWNTSGTPTRGLFKRRINSYNDMAKQMGLPLVTSYDWGDGKGVARFDSKFEKGEGADKFAGKDSIRFSSKGITTGATSYESTNGVFD